MKNKSESESENQPVDFQLSKRHKKNVVRKYDSVYLKFGFISVDRDGVPRPMCLICREILANSSMLPTKLVRHLQTKHPESKDQPIQHFELLKNEWNDQSKNMVKYTQSELASIESSFHVALQIAKAKKPLSIGEELIQPCFLKIAEMMFDKAAAIKLNSIPLSRRTISRRFADMAMDVKN